MENKFREWAKEYEIENKDIVLDSFKDSIQELVLKYFEDKNMFSPSDLKLYYYDEYKLRTNTCKNTCATLYLEINQVMNIKPSEKSKLIEDRYLTLKQIKNDIFELSVSTFDSNTLIWQEKYSINYAINVFDEEDNKFTHYFKIIPCFTYVNENNISGVIYYTNDKILTEIEYPKLSIRNFKLKNKSTNDLFAQTILLFKRIFMYEKQEKDLPFEIFEILLYTVPDEMYQNLKAQTLNNIIDYIRRCGIQTSKTIDQQQEAFKSKYKSLSSIYASMAIKKIDRYFKSLK